MWERLANMFKLGRIGIIVLRLSLYPLPKSLRLYLCGNKMWTQGRLPTQATMLCHHIGYEGPMVLWAWPRVELCHGDAEQCMCGRDVDVLPPFASFVVVFCFLYLLYSITVVLASLLFLLFSFLDIWTQTNFNVFLFWARGKFLS